MGPPIHCFQKCVWLIVVVRAQVNSDHCLSFFLCLLIVYWKNVSNMVLMSQNRLFIHFPGFLFSLQCYFMVAPSRKRE